MSEFRVTTLARRFTLAFALGALGLGAVGCGKDSSTSTSTTGPTNTAVTSPKGTLVGSVLDNNGNPVSGATVSIPDGSVSSKVLLSGKVQAKLSVTTDAAGQFSIPNVVATNVVNANTGGGSCNDTGCAIGQPIPVQVSKTGFLGATLLVNPQAQVVGDAGGEISSTTNPATYFIDGFTASAGVVKIPALTTTVKGTLRNGTTGAPIAGANVDLDFHNYTPDNGGAGGGTNPGVAIQYADPGILTQVTAADGSFTFTTVADDSCFDLASPGLVIDSASVGLDGLCAGTAHAAGTLLFGTHIESANTVVLGDVTAHANLVGDITPPYVVSVAQVLTQSTNPGLLASGVDGTGGLQISFSETVTIAATPHVIVTETTGSTPFVVPATATTSGGILTVTTSTALKPGATVTVAILAQDVKDGAGNVLSSGVSCGSPPTPAGCTPVEVGYDGPDADARYVDLHLQVFKPAVTGLTPPLPLVQNFLAGSAAANADSTLGACPNSVALFTSSNAFLDGSPDTATGFGCVIAQLNSEDAPRSFFGSTSIKGHLFALESALLGGTPVGILTEQANVSFTPSGAVDYVVEIKDSTGHVVGLVSPDIVVLPVGGYTATKTGTIALDPPYGDSAGNGIIIKPAAGAPATTPINLLVGPVLPGDTVWVVPRGTGGVVSSDVASAATLVLQDNGRPTVGVQIIAAALQAAAASAGGSGAGPVKLVSVGGGEPIYPVTPLAYDNSGVSTTSYSNEDLNGANEPGGLSSPPLVALLPTATTTTYDATGWAAFVAGKDKNTLGVSVTEPLSTTATQPAPTYTGTASIAFNSVLKNVFSPADGSSNNDLYVIDVADVTKLEADGRSNSVDLDLTGIVDTSGLAADAGSNAKAQVRDVTPPFVTKAYWDGLKIVVGFSEPVVHQGHLVFTTCSKSVDLDSTSGSGGAFDTTTNNVAANQATDVGNVITIPSGNSAFVAAGIDNTCFVTSSPAPYAETILPSGTKAVEHGGLTWADVEDTANNSDIGLGDVNGANTWAYWTSTFSGTLGIKTPTFAVADLLGPFQVASATCVTNTVASPNTVQYCDLQLTHSVKLTGNCGVTPCTAAAISTYLNSLFRISNTANNAFISPTGTSYAHNGAVSVIDDTGFQVHLDFANQAVPTPADGAAGSALRFVPNGGVDTGLVNLQSGIDPAEALGTPAISPGSPSPATPKVCQLDPILNNLTTTATNVPTTCP